MIDIAIGVAISLLVKSAPQWFPAIEAVWNCHNFADMVPIKTLFSTGVRVSELVAIRPDDVDGELCQIRITE